MKSRDVPSFPVAPIMRHLGYDAPDIRKGERVKVRCWWHEDNNPSATVSYYGFICFGCGKTFDALKLLMDEEGLNFEDALRTAAEVTGTGTTAVPAAPGWGDILSG